MKSITACPVCGNESTKGWPSMVAPFVAERLLYGQPLIGQLLECDKCRFRFTNLRMDEVEVDRFYANYREEDYFTCRHQHEPWYSKRINDELGRSSKEIRRRQGQLEAVLRKSQAWDEIQSVLDFGGDQGQFIPETLHAKKWVYDISGIRPVPGVESLKSIRDLDGQNFDLVMVCHVLEHVMNPADFLMNLAQFIAPSGKLYIEVPLERPHFSSFATRLTQRWYEFLIHRPSILRVVDFLSTVVRIFIGWLPPFGLLKTSEHVNFFNESSLHYLLKSNGFTCVYMEIFKSKNGLGRAGIIHCLSQLT